MSATSWIFFLALAAMILCAMPTIAILRPHPPMVAELHHKQLLKAAKCGLIGMIMVVVLAAFAGFNALTLY